MALAKPLERDVQQRFLDRMHALGCFAQANGVHDRNRGRSGRSGLGPGSPDVLVIVSPLSFAFFAEIKRPGETRRPNQIAWELTHARPYGVRVFEIDSFEAIDTCAAFVRRVRETR